VDLLFLEHDDRISLQVRHVHTFPLHLHGLMFLRHKPSHVGEEEASSRIMWVGIRFHEFVMDSVVPAPLVDAVLCS
jgi:hypothetical protein